MRLPLTSLKRAGALTAAAAAVVAAVGLIVMAQAGAHPGPTDTSGGHYCTQAQQASGACAPATYHRHDDDGDAVIVTPGPEAAQLTGQQNNTVAAQPATGQPFTPGGATTPTTAPPGGVPATTTPPAQPAPLADTGPMDMKIALFGAVLCAMGLTAVAANRRMPVPVVLELDRRPIG